MDSPLQKSILVVAEHDQQGLKPVTYELVAFARKLQSIAGFPVEVAVVGAEIEAAARQVAQNTGLPVTGIRTDGYRGYTAQGMTSVLTAFFSRKTPVFLLAAHTSRGQEYIPGLAAALDGECITGVEGLTLQESRICFHRSIYGGKATALVGTEADCTFLTLQPGVHPVFCEEVPAAGPVEWLDLTWPENGTRALGIRKGAAEYAGITEAEVVVAAGRGIGGQENLDLIQDLAALFPRSAVAGSRPVCDAGWLAYKQQVGVTGATITPELYIACGISGAIQHLGGIRGAKCIVAINRDPKAAIFNMADIVVVEDLTVFIPAFIAAAAEDGGETGRK